LNALPALLLALILMLPVAVRGQSPAAPGAAVAQEHSRLIVRASMTELDGYLEAGFAALQRRASAMAGRLRPAGLRLLSGLSLCALAWTGLRTLLGHGAGSQMLAEGLGRMALIAILYGLIDRWPAAPALLDQSMTQLAALASGGPLGPHEVVQGVGLALDPAIAILATAVKLPASVLPTELVFWAVALLLKLAVALVALACGAVYISTYAVGLCLLSLATALGPVILPWLLVGPLSFLATGWLRFTLGAALYKLLAVLVIVLAGSLREPIAAASQAAATGSSETVNLAATTGALLLVVVLARIMLQIPQVARGLCAGSEWRGLGAF
jgi:TrbL/VirB6 plasmid conjugal transfer protein